VEKWTRFLWIRPRRWLGSSIYPLEFMNFQKKSGKMKKGCGIIGSIKIVRYVAIFFTYGTLFQFQVPTVGRLTMVVLRKIDFCKK